MLVLSQKWSCGETSLGKCGLMKFIQCPQVACLILGNIKMNSHSYSENKWRQNWEVRDFCSWTMNGCIRDEPSLDLSGFATGGIKDESFWKQKIIELTLDNIQITECYMISTGKKVFKKSLSHWHIFLPFSEQHLIGVMSFEAILIWEQFSDWALPDKHGECTN